MKKFSPDMPMKPCTQCGVEKVIEFGFYKRSENAYMYKCKVCHKKNMSELEIKKHNGEYKIHNWSKEDDTHHSTCLRCGLERKKEANTSHIGRWINYYRTDIIWSKKRPKCIVIKN